MNLKKVNRVISLVLVLVLLVSTINTPVVAEVDKQEFLKASELNFETIVDNNEQIQIQLKTQYMQEDRIVYDCFVDKDTNSVKVDMIGYDNGEESYSEPFSFSIEELQENRTDLTIENINANDIIQLLRNSYEGGAEQFETIVYDENNSESIVDIEAYEEIRNTNDEEVVNSMSSAYADVAYGLVPVGSLAAALLTFLSANWALIAVVLVIIVAVGTAYLLYEYLQTMSYTQEYEYAKSSRKHMSETFVKRMVKRKSNVIEEYYSLKQNRTLLVYNITKGTRADVNKYIGTKSTWTQKYELTNFDLTGFKLLVLIDMDNSEIFHVELRYGSYARKQIEHLRYNSDLSLQLLPIVKYDPKYENQNSPGGAGTFQVPTNLWGRK